MTMTLMQLTGLKPPVPYVSKHGLAKELPQDGRLVGIELEIENFNPEHEQRFGGFHFTADGSLRSTGNGIGIEAITSPVPISKVPGLLTAFFNKFEITDRNYSERCSTHVHFNVLDLTPEQLATLGLLYQTVERLLFQYVSPNRKDSIFCVPWYQSGLTYDYVTSMMENPKSTKNWQKYSALNLIPIYVQGSIEFRHLEGTCDVARITNWISFIGKLFDAATTKSLAEVRDELCNMNTVSNYREWLTTLFGGYAEHFLNLPDYERALFHGVVDSKYMLSSGEKPLLTIAGDVDSILARYGLDTTPIINVPAAQQMLRAAAAERARATYGPGTPLGRPGVLIQGDDLEPSF